jgi:hypothetical protein
MMEDLPVAAVPPLGVLATPGAWALPFGVEYPWPPAQCWQPLHLLRLSASPAGQPWPPGHYTCSLPLELKVSQTAAATMPMLDVLAAGAAAASSLPSSLAMWARAEADLVAAAPAEVPAFFPLAILLGELFNEPFHFQTRDKHRLGIYIRSYIKSSASYGQYQQALQECLVLLTHQAGADTVV